MVTTGWAMILGFAAAFCLMLLGIAWHDSRWRRRWANEVDAEMRANGKSEAERRKAVDDIMYARW